MKAIAESPGTKIIIGEKQILMNMDKSSHIHAHFVQVAHVLSVIPSYELEHTVIPGTALKLIGDSLKSFDVELAQVLPTSVTSLYRQFKKEDIDTELKDKLVSLMRIMEKGIHAFEDPEDFKEWLTSKIENLGNCRPIDLLALETGRREVEQAIDRVEYGIYG